MDYSSLVDTLFNGLSTVGTTIVTYLPRLLTAAIVLIIGWLTARLLKAIIVRLLRGLDSLWSRFIVRKELTEVQKRYPPAKVVGEISFWLIILFFASMAANIMGLTAFVTWISQLVAFFPLLIAGLVIIGAGIVVSSLVRDLVAGTASTAGVVQAELLGRVIQVIILITSVVIGVDQIGIDITFLSIMAAILLATTLGAVALAFGFGARNHVANIIAGHTLRQQYRTGDSVRIAGYQGKILSMESSHVVLDTPEGEVSVPASVFDAEAAALTEREE